MNGIVASLAAVNAISMGLLVASTLKSPETGGADTINVVVAALQLYVLCGKHVRHCIYRLHSKGLRSGWKHVLCCNKLSISTPFYRLNVITRGPYVMYCYYTINKLCSSTWWTE